MSVKGLSNLTIKLSSTYWKSSSNSRTKQKRFNHKSMRNGPWHFSTKQKLQGLKDLHSKACLADRMRMQLNTGVNIHGALQRCFLCIEDKEEKTELCQRIMLISDTGHSFGTLHRIVCLQILKSMLR